MKEAFYVADILDKAILKYIVNVKRDILYL